MLPSLTLPSSDIFNLITVFLFFPLYTPLCILFIWSEWQLGGDQHTNQLSPLSVNRARVATAQQ